MKRSLKEVEDLDSQLKTLQEYATVHGEKVDVAKSAAENSKGDLTISKSNKSKFFNPDKRRSVVPFSFLPSTKPEPVF